MINEMRPFAFSRDPGFHRLVNTLLPFVPLVLSDIPLEKLPDRMTRSAF